MGGQNVFDQAAGAYGGGLQQLGSVAQGNQQSAPAVGMTQAASRGYGNAVGAPAVQRTMRQYLNPYQDQVIDNLTQRIGERRDETMNNLQAQALQGNAFGGSRHALLEAETLGEFAQAENEAVSGALQSGFDRAMQFGQGQQGLEQASAGGQLAAAQALNNLGLSNAQLGLNAAQTAINAAPIGQQLGMSAIQQQMQAGDQVQRLNQGILDRASGQFDAYSNQGVANLSAALGAVQGNPLAAAQTQTSSYNPGLFDYLGLGAGLGSSYLRGGK